MRITNYRKGKKVLERGWIGQAMRLKKDSVDASLDKEFGVETPRKKSKRWTPYYCRDLTNPKT
jgi:hypothetical protein